MKHLYFKILLLSIFIILNTSGFSQTWRALGSDDAVAGSKGFISNSISTISLAISPLSGNPYVAFNDSKPAVKQFQNGSWVNVGPAFTSNLWDISVKVAYDGTPYIATIPDQNQTQIKKLENNEWINYGGLLSSKIIDYTILENGDLYLQDGQYKLKKYSDGTWMDANTGSTESVYSIPYIGSNGHLYVTTGMNGQYFIKDLNSSSYVSLGSQYGNLRSDRNKGIYVYSVETNSVIIKKLENGILTTVSTYPASVTSPVNLFFDSKNAFYLSYLVFENGLYAMKVVKLVSGVWSTVGSNAICNKSSYYGSKAAISLSDNIFATCLTADGVFGKVYGTYSTLPVTLLNYTASKTSTSVQLAWSTSTEQNNSRYVLERSSNGRDFIQIGTLESTKDTSVASAYSFSDFNPVNGVIYYRLTQVDKEGTQKILGIKEVDFSLGLSEIASVYPNPIDGNFFSINLPSSDKEIYNIQVVDLNGREVLRTSAKQLNGKIQVTTGNKLAAGIYLLKVEGLESQKIIVK